MTLLDTVTVWNKLRITCVAGCGGPACAAVAVCVPDNTSRGDPPPCPQHEQWCPFQHKCLPLSSPCPPSSCPNCTEGHHLPQGELRPRYSLQHEVAFTLPAGPAAHVVVRGSAAISTEWLGQVERLQCFGFGGRRAWVLSKQTASSNVRLSG